MVTLRRAIPYMTGENGTLLPGVLEYITEGIVPLIYTYYSSLFVSTSLVEQDEEEFELSVQIASALLVSLSIKIYQHRIDTILLF